MKVLLFRRSISGEDGSTKVLTWLANSLSKEGHEVVVLSQDKEQSEPFYPLDDDVKQIVNSAWKYDSASGFWDDVSMKFRGKVMRLADAGSFGPGFALAYMGFFFTRSIYKITGGGRAPGGETSLLLTGNRYYARWKKENLAQISSLTDSIRKEQPDVIVSFFTAAHFLVAEAAKRSKTPIVCFYNGDPRVYPQRIGERFTELSGILSSQAVTILDSVFYNDLSDHDRRVAHVIPNYVGKIAPTTSESPRKKTIVSVGRLHPQKNHELLIEAFAKIEKKHPDWRVEIYGEGQYRQELERKIMALGLHDRVSLKGATRDIGSVYASSSIHAFPSLCEGFGLVVIEAMSARLPSVSVAGVYPSSDFVVRSGAGLIAQPTAEDFAQKIEQLIEAPELREEMGNRGSAYAENFSSRSILDKWTTLLDEVSRNGLTPTETRESHAPSLAAGERLPVPESATYIPEQARRESLSKKARKGKGGSRVLNAWHAEIPSKLDYPRLHPENAYDALDFLRTQKVSDLNQKLVQQVRHSVADSGRKIRIGFLVSEKEKWNGDHLIREFQDSGLFESSFAVQLSSTSARLSRAERTSDYEEQVAYFKGKGKVEYELYNMEKDQPLAVEIMDYDVVFIQQPWGAKDVPRRLIGRMLCVYMHYGFIMMANHGMHYNISSFHSYLWRYFTQTEMHRQMHVDHDPSANDKVVVTGYPKLDVYLTEQPSRTAVSTWKNAADGNRQRIIFAPHHSVERNSLGMATFPWSGQELASLRDQDDSVDWLYKPHPRMSLALQRAGLMTKREYDDYVEAWETSSNSSVYDDGDYFDIFRSSDALITDCGSFLAEYLPTGKPIIWMLSDRTVGLNAVGQHISQSFYVVRTPEELRQVYNHVVVEKRDPLASIRRVIAQELLPSGMTSSALVVNNLKSAFGL